jgi:DNA-binding CsgD family transcriptional regulator/GAF domain-containing protein
MLTRHAAAELYTDVSIELAHAPADIEAIMALATSRLSRLRAGTWVAVVMNPHTETSRIFVADERDREIAQYIDDYVTALDMPHRVATVGLSQRAIESGCPVVVPRVSIDEFLLMLSPAGQAYCRDHPPPGGVRSIGLVIVPMRVGAAILGTLGVLDARDRHLVDESDPDWIQPVADRVALSVEHARLVQGTLVQAAELDVMRAVVLADGLAHDLRLTLEAIVERLTALRDLDAADVMLPTDDGQELTVAASAGYRWPWPPQHRVDARWAELARRPRKPEIGYRGGLELAGHDPRRSLFTREAFQTFIAIPLHARMQPIGLLNIYSRSYVQWEQNRLEFLETVGGLAAMAIDHAAAHPPDVPSRPATSSAFSDLESEILRLIAEGFTNREIAARVHRSESTVKFHVRRLLEKAGAASRAVLVARAFAERWI